MHTGTRKRLNVIGCCDWEMRPVCLSFVEGKVGGAEWRRWLSKLAKTCSPEVPTHLWLDNGPIHKSKLSLAAIEAAKDSGLLIHFLPAYSPELNRIEMMWRVAKRRRPFMLLEIPALRKTLDKIFRMMKTQK
jgi:hypothetical protein